MDLLFTHDKPTLAVGPTGTGKSTYVQQLLLRGLPKETYSAILTGFSAIKFNDDSVRVDRLDRRRKGGFGPCWQKYVLFVDDLSMPEIESTARNHQ